MRGPEQGEKKISHANAVWDRHRWRGVGERIKKKNPRKGTETGELLAVKLFLLQIVKTELSGKRRDTNAGNKEKINKKLPENRTDDAIPLYTWKFI